MLTLYSTLGCHLCEHAKAVMANCLEEGTVLDEVDIADDEALMEAYGIRIPVVKDPRSGKEIGWPFDEAQFNAWLRAL